MANITRDVYDVSSRPVGYGGLSDIYSGIWSSPHGPVKVAIKVVRAVPNDPGISKVKRRLEKEMRVWKGLSHINVQKFSGIYDSIGSLPALVSPWCERGNIKSFVMRRASDLSIKPAKLNNIKLNLLIGVMSGVQFLHDNRIVHGDIKGDNILISDSGAPLVCDFGLSRATAELSQSSTQTSPKGTWRWMAPELCLVEGARHSYKTDMWACGCLFIEVWSSLLPYHSKINQQQFFLAVDAGEGPCPARPASMPDFVWARVQECCNFDARHRPSPSSVARSLASSRQSRTSVVLESAVLSVSWFPDGNRVVVGCREGSIYILNLVTGATLFRLVGHTADVNEVAVSSNGRLLASCSDDWSIRLWDAQTGHAIRPPMVGHTGSVCSVDFSSDGCHIISGSRDDTIRVWSTRTGVTVLGSLHVPVDPSRRSGRLTGVRSVAYSPDGSRIVSGSLDETVRVWDACTGDLILTIRGHTDSVQSVACSPDGLCIVSGSDDYTVRVWNTTTDQLVGSPLEGHSHRVCSVAYSPDGAHIASTSYDCTIRIWDATTHASIATLQGHKDRVFSIAFSPDGKRVASASGDGTIRIWDATDNWRCWDM